MKEDQIKHMVSRFLGWKLPRDTFNPDCGISFDKKPFNTHTPHPMKYEPSGTNLFDATQADAMVRYMIDGLPPAIACQPAIDGLLTNLLSLETALREEKMGAIADLIRGFVREYHKTNEMPEPGPIDWGKVAVQIESRAGQMHRENTALPPAARNTPFGVMTGTATIILSMLAEALDVGRGKPTGEAVNAIIARIQSDRGAFALAKLGLKPGAAP